MDRIQANGMRDNDSINGVGNDSSRRITITHPHNIFQRFTNVTLVPLFALQTHEPDTLCTAPVNGMTGCQCSHFGVRL